MHCRTQNAGTRSLCEILGLAVVCVIGGSTRLAADPINIIFTIDPSQSNEVITGSDNQYGTFSAQSAGSLQTTLSGNFVVAFDPSTDTPQTLQFGGTTGSRTNGFYQYGTSVPSATPFGTPANLAGTTTGGAVQFAVRNAVFNLFSAPISASSTNGLSETFTGNTVDFWVLSGGIDWQTPLGTVSNPWASTGGRTTAGTAVLSESAAGSGQWTLNLSGYFAGQYPNGVTMNNFSSGNLTFTTSAIATAQYSVTGPNSNLSSVSTPTSTPVSAQALGGAGTTDGVTGTFNPGATGGNFSVQQVPGLSSLSNAAVTAAQSNPEFLLSTSNQSIGAPQIWSVQYDGSLNGTMATLVFDYDPSLLPAGTDQSQLGIWHYDENLGQWVFGGTVDVADHTITFVTGSFSPFELGLQTPEPSTFVLAAAGLSLLAFFRRRVHSPSASIE